MSQEEREKRLKEFVQDFYNEEMIKLVHIIRLNVLAELERSGPALYRADPASDEFIRCQVKYIYDFLEDSETNEFTKYELLDALHEGFTRIYDRDEL